MDYTNWYALSIQTNKERTTKAQLLARKAKTLDTHLQEVEYLKRKEIVIDKGGKRKVREKLVTPGYLYVRVDPEFVENEDGTKTKVFPGSTFNMIMDTPGTKFFVNCNRQNPKPVRPREVKKMFEMCDDAHLEVKQNILSDFQEGDQLDVVSGPWTGLEAEVISIKNSKIIAQLKIFGRETQVELTKDQVLKSK